MKIQKIIFSLVTYYTLSYAHNNTLIKLLHYVSLEEEDFREINQSDETQDIKNGEIPNPQQKESISNNVMSDAINHSKEKDAVSATGIEPNLFLHH